MQNNKVDILGSMISVWSLHETADQIQELVATKGKHYICVSNVHTVVMGQTDAAYQNVTNKATLATADGLPLVWASKFLAKDKSIHARASGPDILHLMLTEPQYKGLRHFFYGSTPTVLESLKKTMETKYPNAEIAGYFSPPIRPSRKPEEALSEEELEECRNLNEAQADVIWVGLGAPKQEVWMYRARAHLTAPVLIGVGAAFDFLSGNKKRAPMWMQKTGLEWAYRLLQEPKRLTTRYLQTNPKFVFEVSKQIVREIF